MKCSSSQIKDNPKVLNQAIELQPEQFKPVLKLGEKYRDSSKIFHET